MKIVKVKPWLVDRWMLVQVHTDEGTVGTGEAGLWAHPKVVEEAVKEYGSYFIGKDPFDIEHHWQTLYRNTHFSGSVLSSAMSALDIALWDILGKSTDLPVHRLLGGKCRDKARLYAQVGGNTLEELAEKASTYVKEGFTALRVTPFTSDASKTCLASRIETAVEQVEAIREAVGDGVDLGVEIHRRLNPGEAIVLGRALEKYRLLFIEDPVPPQSIDALSYVASHVNTPIATGERFINIYQFKELLDKKAAGMIRPDVCLAGGISHCKKVAALAEASFIGVMPHVTGSPVHTAATVQLAACIPNYVLQDYDRDEAEPPKRGVVVEPLRRDGGYLIVPDKPGIGVELNEENLGKYPYRATEIHGVYREDGSVTDW